MSLLGLTVKSVAVTATITAGLTLLPNPPARAYYWQSGAFHSDVYAKDYIIQHESSGRPGAVNPSSGACGLLQAYPCSKLAAACPNWRTDVMCQMNFFQDYAGRRYGSWQAAQQFWVQHRWW